MKKLSKKDFKKMTIYLDMDGVVANWFGGFIKLFPDLTEEELEKLKSYYIKEQEVEDCPIRPKEYWKQWRQKANENNGKFWKELEPFPWAKDLYEMLNKSRLVDEVVFLTSPGKKYTLCWEQKRQWLKEHMNTDKIVITPYKYHCAKDNAILIDDTFKHCKQFIDSGGHAVLWPNPFEILEGKNGTVKHAVLNKNREGISVNYKISDDFDAYLSYIELFDILIPSTALNNVDEYKETINKFDK